MSYAIFCPLKITISLKFIRLQAPNSRLPTAGSQALGDGGRHMLQAPAPAPSSLTPTSPANLYTLSATDAIALLCARNITSVQYVQVS